MILFLFIFSILYITIYLYIIKNSLVLDKYAKQDFDRYVYDGFERTKASAFRMGGEPICFPVYCYILIGISLFIPIINVTSVITFSLGVYLIEYENYFYFFPNTKFGKSLFRLKQFFLKRI